MSEFDSSPTSRKIASLPDGRSLGYVECSDPTGKPMFHFHGHPGSGFEAKLLAPAAERAGVRVIGIDRPGMGLSDFKPGRQILDWPDDVAHLADILGIEHFAVEGVSGGGPYAAACAYKISDRLTSCGIVAGLGPIQLLGTQGMMIANRIQFLVARRFPWLLRPALWLVVGRNGRYAQDKGKIEEIFLKFWRGLSEVDRNAIGVDRNAIGDDQLGRLYVTQLLEAFRRGSMGPAYDAMLYVHPWAFRLEDIPFDNVHLWHGELDVNVPVSMGRAVAKSIPNCHARFYPDETHLSVAFNHLEEVMEAMKS